MKNTGEIYTVSQINSLVKAALEETLPSQLVIKGEITNFKHHPSGHCYFSLKDEKSNLPCAMWKPKARRIRFRPENGMAVLATGFIDVYVPHGKYQLIVDELVPAGVGALQLAFEQMVKKLRDEGLFDDEHKKPLPAYPQRIGILTSGSGAAVHDIIDSIHNRWPCVELLFYPVPVQGKGAAEKIAAALRDINKRNKELKLDVLIVGRGGGSMEDLWEWNLHDLLKEIHLPIRCIAAGKTFPDPENREKYRSYFQTVFMEGLGHCLFWEEPEEFNRLLAEQVQSILSEKDTSN